MWVKTPYTLPYVDDFRHSCTVAESYAQNKQTDTPQHSELTHDSKCVFMTGYRPNDQY